MSPYPDPTAGIPQYPAYPYYPQPQIPLVAQPPIALPQPPMAPISLPQPPQLPLAPQQYFYYPPYAAYPTVGPVPVAVSPDNGNASVGPITGKRRSNGESEQDTKRHRAN